MPLDFYGAEMTIAELVAILGAAAALLTVAVSGLVIVGRVGKMAGSMESTLTSQNLALAEMKLEIKGLANVVTQQAVQSTRLDNLSTQVTLISQTLEELRHGEGWVFPSPIPPSSR